VVLMIKKPLISFYIILIIAAIPFFKGGLLMAQEQMPSRFKVKPLSM